MDSVESSSIVLAKTVRDWYPRIGVFVRSFSGLTDEDREDAVQEIMLKLSRNDHSRDRKLPYAPWAYAVARNHCLDVLRRRGREGAAVPFDEANPGHAFSESDQFERVHAKELKDHVGSYLETLDDGDRQIAYLRFFESMRYRDMAALLNQPSGTLRYRVHRIRRNLVKFLEEIHMP
jgi:RNA polymerase sigma-70 factor (ECF subfamily)